MSGKSRHCSSEAEADKYSGGGGGGVGDRVQRENRQSSVNKVRLDPLREDSRS